MSYFMQRSPLNIRSVNALTILFYIKNNENKFLADIKPLQKTAISKYDSRRHEGNVMLLKRKPTR